jgi:hypothetical protein
MMNNAQDMLYTKRNVESLGLHVQLPMILEVYNKGEVELVKNYSVGGRIQYVETRQYFLRQLKEEGIIKVIWTPGELNSSDTLLRAASRFWPLKAKKPRYILLGKLVSVTCCYFFLQQLHLTPSNFHAK